MHTKNLLALSALAALAASAAHATTTNINVSGSQGPWEQSINPNLPYGTGDNQAPASASAGFDFAVGGVFTITYISGTTTNGLGSSSYDALGQTSYLANDNGGTSGDGFPSKNLPSSDYPVYLSEVVGAFADANGKVIGTPFVVGDGAKETVTEVGVTQLLLGVNDDIFDDNSGSLTMQVSGPTAAGVPEPATWAIMLAGFGGLGVAMRSRRRQPFAAI